MMDKVISNKQGDKEELNAESDDDTVVEHSEGQTINISHANVVIFD